MTVTAYSAEVNHISDPDAAVQIEITINDHKAENLVIDMSEELANKICFQLAGILQDIAQYRKNNS